MLKEVKTLAELRALIESEVRKNPGFNDVVPLSAYWHERDADGCNWNVSHWSGPAHVVTAASNTIRPRATELRLKYDAPAPLSGALASPG